MSPAGRRRRALKLQARQLFFRYRRPCLLAALLVVCLSLLAQTFSAVAGGALYYDFLDVRQLPLGTGLWLADAGERPGPIHAGPRVGIDYAEEAVHFPWRFWL